jgi:HEPN domain-containing protein/predicted nucleotidyltransferase
MEGFERFPPDDPREWIIRARSKLNAARARPDGVYLDDLCYDAHQAAEKGLKAVLIARGIRYPYVHDVEVLLDLLASRGEEVPAEVLAAIRLNVHGRYARYPGRTPATESDYATAIEDARAVVDWAAERVARIRWVREPRLEGYGNAWHRTRAATFEAGAEPGQAPLAWKGDPAAIREVVERVVAAAGPQRIIVFGSVARGGGGEHSDLDLLVVKEEPFDRRDVGDAIRRSLAGLGIPLDLILATPEDLARYGNSIALVYLPALEEGRVVYEAGV